MCLCVGVCIVCQDALAGLYLRFRALDPEGDLLARGASLEHGLSVVNSMLPSQFQDMLYVSCPSDRKTGRLQTADTELNTIN